jgi:hypothetical protein
MLAIVTTLRSRLLARDWDYHVWLLQRTLESTLNQSNDSFIVAVVCHEVPNISHSNHSRIKFLPVDFPVPQRNNDDMCADKALKLSVGTEWAISCGCNYVMFADADDLLNRRIAEFVSAHSGANGWYTPTDYIYAYGSSWIRKYSRPPTFSGPVVIVRSDLLKFATVPFEGHWLNLTSEGGEKNYVDLLARRGRKVVTLAAAGLAHFKRLMELEGFPLAPLPMAATVIINHSDSTSHIAGGIGTAIPNDLAAPATMRRRLGRYRRLASTLPSIRPLTRALRDDFAIPEPKKIPAAYRGRGSMFSRDINAQAWLANS